MKPFYQSKKFWAAIIGMAFVFIGDNIGLSPEQVTDAVMVIIALIAGIGAADWGKEAKALEKGEAPK